MSAKEMLEAQGFIGTSEMCAIVGCSSGGNVVKKFMDAGIESMCIPLKGEKGRFAWYWKKDQHGKIKRESEPHLVGGDQNGGLKNRLQKHEISIELILQAIEDIKRRLTEAGA